MLEPCDGKLSRTVLRGEGSREAPDLPGVVRIESEVPKMSEGKIFRSNAKDIVGEIEWDLEDCETGEWSESGKRPITAEEVVVEWHLQRPASWFFRTLKNLFFSKYGFYNKSVEG